MSLLLLSRPRVVAGVAPAPEPEGVTTVAAQIWRFDGNSGSVRVSSGFPLKPGMVTDANRDQVALFVAGTEQAIAEQPMRGRWPDGSYRSLGVQTVQTLTNGVPVVAELRINQGARTTTDLTWQEPVYNSGSATIAGMQNKAVIAPSDPQYVCDTLVCLTPLQPASLDGTGDVATFFSLTDTTTIGALSEFYGRLGASKTNASGTATYEHNQSQWAAYARSGVRSWYEDAYETHLNQMVSANIAGIGTAQTVPHARVWGGADSTLPVISPTSAAGRPAEWNSTIYTGVAASYWMTGWRQGWRHIAYMASAASTQANSTAITTYAHSRGRTVADEDIIRFNVGLFQYPLWIAYITEATMNVSGGFGVGRTYGAVPFATELDWHLDALEEFAYTAGYSTGYMEGIVGQRQTATLRGAVAAGEFPTFQLIIIARALIVYYANIFPDSRIPTWLQTMADVVISQMVDEGNRYTIPYLHDPNPTSLIVNSADDNQRHNYYAPMFTEIFGWVYAHTGDTTYRTWADRCANVRELQNPSPFIATVKGFGEYYGGHQQSYLFYRNGGAVRPIPGAHPTAYIEPREFTS